MTGEAGRTTESDGVAGASHRPHTTTAQGEEGAFFSFLVPMSISNIKMGRHWTLFLSPTCSVPIASGFFDLSRDEAKKQRNGSCTRTTHV